jgi:hypothetical protein
MIVSDPGKRGYVAAVNFLDKMYDLSHETDSDAILRKIYTGTRLFNEEMILDELRQHDYDQDGNLEKFELKKALKNLKVNIGDSDLEILFGAMGRVIQK